ncbi:glycoside hydrolase family 3 N-terminal domain-containing protein [Nesterenkonia sp. CL21]|uniref:glycoside hydrolase family 3 N-terminal domain-containing protein n=1 Tax=Nesterenkonia sp. CL21 TaxID=3064894 RepID=UPI00287A810F|nr:glycoside hydrolase family 3 N-terminal domain-containing protein [Nesterenkonia sp. CL21]MDS2172061.1 glycoside hydrolase family 3 N-terminal domain-containing protein [Nesterenkonia sp. CL21]
MISSSPDAPRAAGRMTSALRRLAPLLMVPALLLSSCASGDDGGAGDDADGTGGGASGDGQNQDQQERDQQEQDAQERREAFAAREAALAGPGDQHRDAAAAAVAELSIDEQAGQVLVGEYGGTDASGMAGLIEELHLAGAIVMGDNVPRGEDGADLDALAGELDTLHQAAVSRDWPAVVAVDQEGGLVTRVGHPLTEWPAPMAYGAARLGALDGQHSDEAPEEAPDEAAEEAAVAGHDALAALGHRAMGEDLAELGFTMDFAPNADVTLGAEDVAIGSRSFGADPQLVADLALAGLRGLAEGGLAGSAKHFPGHGGVTEDSHLTLPVQPAELSELEDHDWAPFQQVIEAGAPMIMMGHLDVPALEAGVPSSLSPVAYERLREMGHDGVIVTDALNMTAVVDQAGPAEAPVRALEAGADLLLMPSDVRTAHAAIVDAVESGRLEEDRLTEAAERVVALMLWQQDLAAGELDAGPGVALPEVLQGLEEEVEQDGGGYADLPSITGEDAGEDAGDGAAEVAAAVARHAVTLVAGQCEADVLQGPVTVVGGQEQDRARLESALQAAGHQLGAGGAVIGLVAPGAPPSQGADVVVALDRPEPLRLHPAETQVALYGRGEESFAALVEVLAGAPAPGALPTPVGEHEVGHSVC